MIRTKKGIMQYRNVSHELAEIDAVLFEVNYLARKVDVEAVQFRTYFAKEQIDTLLDLVQEQRNFTVAPNPFQAFACFFKIPKYRT